MPIKEKIKLKEESIGYLMENARIAIAKGNLARAKAYFQCINVVITDIEKLENDLKVHQEMQQIASRIKSHMFVWEIFPNHKN